MEARNLDLNEWVLAGGGVQGESYNHRNNPDLMLKLFNKGFDISLIEQEIGLSRNVAAAGVPCPAPGELVCHDGRFGIVFQRIRNKSSFCTAISKEPSRCKEFAQRLAQMALKLHSMPSDGTPFTSVFDYYAGILQELDLEPGFRSTVTTVIESLKSEDSHTLIHGDFHFGNVITDGQKDYFIDLGAFAYGNPDFDNAMLFGVCEFAEEEMVMHNYHITLKQADEFWQHYKVAYYGQDAPSDEVLKKRYAPYLLVRTLFFERDMGSLPVFDKLRQDLISLLG